ncbi:non-ribosomal peptide synthetase [Agrobacterium tumefaciens]|uniref:non-ribosomal peptide synthetase n=1 Tax=Agrobacterium tumefaciens TaxID=358 RepID=UPI0022431DC7|nr:non-ribosomal peptide synthetase [Agrobacterium tumefaciens]MCW8060197.1 amino acid adenylation domain-containing protein [Agrobacterium tumefaciens]
MAGKQMSVVPASASQHALWLIDRIDGGNPAYNESLVLRCRYPVGMETIRSALAGVVRRHEALRTSFSENEDGSLQQIIHTNVIIDWKQERLQLEGALPVDEYLAKRFEENSQVPFDLKTAPLIRGYFYEVADSQVVVQLVVHHIIFDGWSHFILKADLEAELSLSEVGASGGNEVSVSGLQGCSVDPERTPDQNRVSVLSSFWKRYLAGLPALLQLPYDRPRSAIQSFVGNQVAVTLGKSETEKIQALARANRSTEFLTLLGAFTAVISRYAGSPDIAIGVPVANRLRAADEKSIGYFANTVVFRNSVDAGEKFAVFLKRVLENAFEVFDHADLPFVKVVEAVNPIRSLAYTPIFQVGFEYHRAFGERTDRDAQFFERIPHSTGTSKTDLTLFVEDTADGLRFVMEYASALFDHDTARRILESVTEFLNGAALDTNAVIGRLPLMSPKSREDILFARNSTQRSFPYHRTIHACFEEKAAAHPEALALRYGGQSLTFGELERSANSVASYLTSVRVGRGSTVAICLPRSQEMIVAILGILKAGAAFVPIDPAAPDKRKQFIISDSHASCVLTDHQHLDACNGTDALVVSIDAAWLGVATSSGGTAVSEPDDVAYVIYTSGTTGYPKGVAITHCKAMNTLSDIAARYPVKPGDRYLFNLNYVFDASVIELFSWFVGDGALVILEPAHESTPELLAKAIVDEKITHMIFPTAMLAPFVAEISDDRNFRDHHRLRYVYVGGAALAKDVAERALHLLKPAQLENHYGPTEASILTTTFTVVADTEYKSVPIGKPISNTFVYILDEFLEPVPIGVLGELYISGKGVADGYINQPDLTLSRFAPNPWLPGEKLYRTGDFCRWLPDGNIDYVGRQDFQVKVRGMRVELGEIEACLMQTELLDDAIVMHLERHGTEGHLVAFVVARRGLEKNGKSDVKQKLQDVIDKTLPAHMRPRIMVLADLPLQASGKTDRQKLSELAWNLDLVPQEDIVPPATPRERELAQIWEELLGRPVGTNQNFFEVGGDSILAIQVAARARRRGIRFNSRDVFRHQTISELAAVSAANFHDEINNSDCVGSVTMTPIQTRFFHWNLPAANHFQQSIMVDVPAGFTLEFLKMWLTAVHQRHDALRQAFEAGQSGHYVHVEDIALASSITICDTDATADRIDANGTRATEAINAVRNAIDIHQAPLLKAVFLTCHNVEDRRLVLICHHLVIDAVSWRILLDDLRFAFEQWSADLKIDFGSKTTSVETWARSLGIYSSTETLLAEKTFWLEQLKPTGCRLRNIPWNPVNTVHVELTWSTEETSALLNDCNLAYRTKTQELLLAAVVRSARTTFSYEEILLALEGHGRESSHISAEIGTELDLSQTVGWFTSYYPLLIEDSSQVTEDEEIPQLIRSVKNAWRRVPASGVGYDIFRHLCLDAEIAAAECVARPDILFNFFGVLDESPATFKRLNDPSGGNPSIYSGQQHAIEINARVQDRKLTFDIAVDVSAFGQTKIDAFVEHLRLNVTEFGRHCRSRNFVANSPDDFDEVELEQSEIDDLRTRYPTLQNAYPVSGLQLGMIFHTMMPGEADAYTNQLFFESDSRFDPEAFERSWNVLIDRHEFLRSAFVGFDRETPLQVISGKVDIPIRRADLRHLSKEEGRKQFEDLRLADREIAFSLDKPPLMRLGLFQIRGGQFFFLWTVHHSILDGWSISVLWRELGLIYDCLRSGIEPRLLPPPEYRNYLRWRAYQPAEKARAFWCSELEGLHKKTALAIEVPSTSSSPAFHSKISKVLGESSSKQIIEAASRHQVTVAALFQAAWALTLSKYAGMHDVLFGTTISGRTMELADVEQMVGLFINTVPVRVSVNMRASVGAWLRELHSRQADREEYGFLDLIEIQRLASISDQSGLFNSLLVFENYPSNIFAGGGQNTFQCQFDERTHYDLALVAMPGEAFTLNLEFNANKFKEQDIADMSTEIELALHRLSRAAENDEVSTIASTMDMAKKDPVPTISQGLSAVTRQGQLKLGRYLVHQLVENHAEAFPLKTALLFNGKSYSYADLNKSANRLANHLLSAYPEIKADDCIGITLPRSDGLLIAILAIWKVGAAYVPLDATLPSQRLASMAKSSSIKVILAGSETFNGASCDWWEGPVVDVDHILADASLSDENPDLNVSGGDLAYVLFTSGSTGEPKGAMVEHIGVLNNIANKVQDFKVDRASIVSQNASQSFDISVWQMFIALSQGGTTVIYDDRTVKDLPRLLEWITRDAITVLEIVPTYLVALTEHLDSLDKVPALALEYLILTGETADARFINRFRAHYPNTYIVNAYGPTEASDDITHYILAPGELAENPVPIGTTLANFDVYVVDDDLCPVPIGTKGEIVVSGVGVCRGYAAMTEATRAAFLTSPFPDRYKGRLYKTGDLGEMCGNGTLLFHGRKDKQVKIRGFRIELEEVEHRLASCANIRQAVVLDIALANHEPFLCGFVVPAGKVDKALIEKELGESLPPYMIPAELRILDHLPLLANGKVDRRGLRDQYTRLDSDEEYVRPSGDVETRLVQIWEDVLGLSNVSVHSNFFTLGGDSFKAIRIAAKYGAPLEVADIYDWPTVRELALHLLNAKADVGRLLVPVVGDLSTAKVRIVAVSNSGGDPISFQDLGKAIRRKSKHVAFHAVKLPRAGETDDSGFREEIARLTAKVAEELSLNASLPTIIYGQCNGSALAISLARHLAQEKRHVVGLFVGGALMRTTVSPADNRTDDEILSFLRSHGSSIPSDPAEAAFFLHDFRYDCGFANAYYNQLIEEGLGHKLVPLNVPLTCMVGTIDEMVSGYQTEYRSWEKISQEIRLVEYKGFGHYLLRDCPELIADTLLEASSDFCHRESPVS